MWDKGEWIKAYHYKESNHKGEEETKEPLKNKQKDNSKSIL